MRLYCRVHDILSNVYEKYLSYLGPIHVVRRITTWRNVKKPLDVGGQEASIYHITYEMIVFRAMIIEVYSILAVIYFVGDGNACRQQSAQEKDT